MFGDSRGSSLTRTYTIERVDGITVVTCHELPSFADTQGVIDPMARERTYHLRLWDFSGVRFGWSEADVRRIAEYGKTKFPERNRIAVVAPEDLPYGVLREFEIHREQHEDAHSLVRAFRTKQEAWDWLESERTELGL